MKKKTIALLLALALILGVGAGGTLAWLLDKTEKVENVFTTSDVTIDLKENTGNEYQMIPGYTIKKDPEVTVKAKSEKCYLYVKVEKSENFDTYMTYAMADGWTQLKTDAAEPADIENVFYRIVEKSDTDQPFAVIKDDTINVKDTVTKELMAEAKGAEPTLTITAYASQFNSSNNEQFTPAQAWKNVNSTATPTP